MQTLVRGMQTLVRGMQTLVRKRIPMSEIDRHAQTLAGHALARSSTWHRDKLTPCVNA
jgi:hypothetical protein